MSKNCPNCGAPLDENYCKCPYCGTLYYDLTVLDDSVPCYVRFRTSMGLITALAKPELREINLWSDSVDITDAMGNRVTTFCRNNNCDIDVSFHTIIGNKKNKCLFTIDTRDTT